LINVAIPHVVATLAAAAVLEAARYGFSSIGLLQMAILFGLSYLAYVGVILLFATKREILWRGLSMISR